MRGRAICLGRWRHSSVASTRWRKWEDHGRHADFEHPRTGHHASVEPDRGQSLAGRHTLGEPTRRWQAIHEPPRRTTYRTLRAEALTSRCSNTSRRFRRVERARKTAISLARGWRRFGRRVSIARFGVESAARTISDVVASERVGRLLEPKRVAIVASLCCAERVRRLRGAMRRCARRPRRRRGSRD